MDMKRKNHSLLLLLMVVLMLFLVPSAVNAEGEREGLYKASNGRLCFYENGKKVTNTWKEINGQKYYFLANGWATGHSVYLNGKVYVFKLNGQLCQPAKKRIFKSDGYTYYINPDGTANTGWLIINNKLYLAYSKSGRFAVNVTKNGIKFGKNGAAVSNTASKLKIRTMQIVSQITNSKMSKSQKLKACWNYMVGGGRFRYYSIYPNIYTKGWQQSTALNMLTSYRGNCYSFACGFAALAAEVGYTPYVIAGRVPGSRDGAADGLTRHCWVQISGLSYDPEGTWAGWAGYIYGSGYYPIYHTVTKVINFNTWI